MASPNCDIQINLAVATDSIDQEFTKKTSTCNEIMAYKDISNRKVQGGINYYRQYFTNKEQKSYKIGSAAEGSHSFFANECTGNHHLVN